MTIKQKAGIFLLIAVILGAVFYSSFKIYRHFQEAKKQSVLLREKWARWTALDRQIAGEVRKFNTQAGLVIKDLSTGWEIAYNKNSSFASASLVKVPIMVVCFQAAGEKRINLQQEVIFKNSHRTGGSGVLKNAPSGSKFTVEKLVEIMIEHSDNTATNMLIDLLKFNYINLRFKEYGLRKTNLSRRMMDFSARKIGIENYTTPRDMAYILEKFYRGGFLSKEISDRCIGLLKLQKYKDRIPAMLPSGAQVAHKTGLERSACHDIGIIFTPQADFLICALTKKGKNAKKAKRFISKISLLAYNCYSGM